MSSTDDRVKGPKNVDVVTKDGRLVPKLCPECTSFLSQLEQHCVGLGRTDEGLDSTGGLALCHHKPNARSLHASAQDGCTLCGWLWKCLYAVCASQRMHKEIQSLEIQQLSFVWQRIPSQDFERRAGARYRFALWCLPVDATKGMALPLPPHRLVIDHLPSQDKALREAVAGIGPSTSSQATVALIRHWMETCMAHHPVCSGRDRSDMDDVLPGRMLDVTSADRIRLIQTSSLGSEKLTPRYAALSHCWGQTNKPQLNTETEEELRRGRPLASLPPMFKQAIKLTRGLGLEYTWIDSLCIVQDSEEDWLAESAKMGGVYSNSTVCISATDAVDHDGGCFYVRECLRDAAEEPVQPPGDAPFRNARGSNNTFNWPFTYNNLVISVDVGLDYGMPATFLRGPIDRAPLNTRAWVFQERMLAPRTVHCTKSQIMWECFEGWSSESHPVAIIAAPIGRESWGGFNAKAYRREVGLIRAANKGIRHLPVSDTVRALQQWSGVIEAYAKKKITFTSDKLVACSAITKITTPTLGNLVAGLWEKHLASQLLWYRERGTEYHAFGWTTDDQMRPRQVPSWSWASVDGEVKLPHYSNAAESFKPPFGYLVNQPPLVEILKVDVALRGEDAIGVVTSGRIRMRGRLFPLFEHDDATYPFHLQPADPGGVDFLVIRWDQMEGRKEQRADRSAQTSEVLQRRDFPGLPIGAMAPLPWSKGPSPSSFVAIPMVVSFGDVTRHTGLILESTGAAKGQYRRCGFFHTSPEYYERLQSMAGEDLARVEAEQYNPEQGHTFTIV